MQVGGSVMENLFTTLAAVLKKDSRFASKEGELLRNAVVEASNHMDAGLLHLLLSNEATKKAFFKMVDSIPVFDKVKFAWVVNNKQFLPDSYTRFKNKIGLADENENMILSTGRVELVFPYKDCVLEGGQTKTEADAHQEIFYNQTLAQSSVDRLLAPKVFTTANLHNINGKRKIMEITDTDNFIIKGNNLLVLSSLLYRYRNKVKCIYIDPPYYFSTDKKEDTFAYNTKFKLSTWLTFMKNRLELARKLLAEDGAIFVQISNEGVGELLVLMKEVFNANGENNFINLISVKTKSPSGFASVNPGVFEAAEYIIGFAKHRKRWNYNSQYVKSSYDANYKWIITNKEKNYSEWKISDINEIVAQKQGFTSIKEAVKTLGKTAFIDLVGKFALDNADRVFRYTAIGQAAGKEVVRIRDLSKHTDDIYCVKRTDHYDIYILRGNEMAFYSKKVKVVEGELTPAIQLSDIWTDTPYEGIAKEGNVTLKGGKKPEKLIKRIIEMSTNKGDIVLDYHLGSGTTCAVAHKLGRQYIGVEQLDYGQNDSIVRLENVINGDNSGISKAVKWENGGSFISCELAKLNETFVEESLKHKLPTTSLLLG